LDEPVDHGGGDDVIAEDFAPEAQGLVPVTMREASFVPGGDELEEQVRGLLSKGYSRPHRGGHPRGELGVEVGRGSE
jgi:hypothetical protein